MIYKVKKEEKVFLVDDLVLLAQQPEEFRVMFNSLLDENNLAAFDNASLMLTDYGRVLINNITDEDGKI